MFSATACWQAGQVFIEVKVFSPGGDVKGSATSSGGAKTSLALFSNDQILRVVTLSPAASGGFTFRARSSDFKSSASLSAPRTGERLLHLRNVREILAGFPLGSGS